MLKTAERLVAKAEQKLSAAMKDKNMDQVAVAHATFEAASKKMKDADETLKRNLVATSGYDDTEKGSYWRN